MTKQSYSGIRCGMSLDIEALERRYRSRYPKVAGMLKEAAKLSRELDAPGRFLSEEMGRRLQEVYKTMGKDPDIETFARRFNSVVGRDLDDDIHLSVLHIGEKTKVFSPHKAIVTRAIHYALRHGFTTVGMIRETSAMDILKLKNMGQKQVAFLSNAFQIPKSQ